MKSLWEYIEAAEQEFKIPSASTGKKIGQIKPRTWNGNQLFVYQVKTDSYELYLVVDSSIGVDKPIGYLGFQRVGTNMLCADNAFIDPDFQKRGILSELMLFVKKKFNPEIISDTHLTVAGIALWNSLVASAFFNAKIADIKLSLSFDFSDIGITLSDGATLIDPKDDNKSYDFYDENTGKGQRFFYLLESPETFTYMVEGKKYSHGYVSGRTGPNDLLSPYGHFADGAL